MELSTKTVRDIALENPASTRVFEEFKIDYCCGGRRSIEDAATAAGVDASLVYEKLKGVLDAPKADAEYPENYLPGDLTDYLIAKHHIYTVNEIERLMPLMAKVVSRHGEQHPELFELQVVFERLVDSVIPHMRKEEMVLFPFIKELDAAAQAGRPAPMPHFGTVNNPIRMMMSEHDHDGDRLKQMRELSGGYVLPEGACPSYTALYAGLEELERDLHRHIHLENNVLFPAAAQLEAR